MKKNLNYKKESLITGLVSNTGGVDFEKANNLGVNVILVLSFPGKIVPKITGSI